MSSLHCPRYGTVLRYHLWRSWLPALLTQCSGIYDQVYDAAYLLGINYLDVFNMSGVGEGLDVVTNSDIAGPSVIMVTISDRKKRSDVE